MSATATPAPNAADDGRDETSMERVDRNLQELRVVVTGVQVLFAFLLIVPFNAGFAHIGSFERTVYFVTLMLAALAAACLIAPCSQHRLLFRHDDKAYLVAVANRSVIAGMVSLALSMCGALLLVTASMFGAGAAAIAATCGAVPIAGLWFALPLHRRSLLGARSVREHDARRR